MKKIIFIAVTIFLIVQTAYSQCNPISIFPWIEGFENNGADLPSCWTHRILGDDPDWVWTVVPNVIGEPNTAQEGNYKVRSFYSNSSVFLNRSMLITPVFDLSSLKKPVLVYWHTQTKGGLRVYYRNDLSEEWKMYLQIIMPDDIPDWQGEVLLLPEKSAHYQIGFENVFSGSGTSEIQLDNIRVMEHADFADVDLVSIITPISGENHTTDEQIKILLKNNGSDPLTGFSLQLELDDSLITTETFTDSIPSLEQAEYTFTTTINLSAETTYKIKVTLIAENDYISSNNSKTINVENIICPKIISFPWIEDFENNGTELPKCWNMIQGGGESWEWKIVPAEAGMPSTAFSGNYKAQICYGSMSLPVYQSRLITPTFDLLAVNTPILIFGYNVQRQNSSLSVYYKNSSIGEWILLKTFLDDIPDWKTAAILLPDKSSDYQIAFESTFLGGGTYEAQLDEIRVFDFIDFVDIELSSITKPITGINHTESEQVTVLLKNFSSLPLTGFKLQLELDGALTAIETFTESIPSLGQAEYTFNETINLSAEDIYQIKVTVIADDDQIHGNNSKTITINNYICNIITSFPWVEGFEHGTRLSPYPCWEQEIVAGDFDWRITTPTYGLPPTTHSGDYMAWFFNFNYRDVHKAKLISPVFDLSTVNNPLLTFWHTQHYDWHRQNTDMLRVYYKNSPSGNWILLKSFLDEIMNWQEDRIELPNPSNYYQIAFEGEVGKGQGVNLDDFSISGNGMSNTPFYYMDSYSLAPNPVQDLLKITCPGTDIVKATIYNSMGIMICSFETSESNIQVDVSNYNSGIYFIRLSNDNISITKRFIKQ